MAEQVERAEQEALYNLVVIGSSAGGIEALSTVLGALAADFPAPIVVAQHLDPNRPSHLDVILTRRTKLTVRMAADSEPLQPGVVYVVPSDRDIEITDHEARLLVGKSRHAKPSVNLLLSSASRVFGERLIAVILTGTGSDGATGAREVKAAGGTVIIEDPATAAFPGMPKSLAPTTVDIVAHLEQIGPILHDLLAGTYIPRSLDPDHPVATQEDPLAPLLEQLRERSGIDFASYRRPTILRRLQRRMVTLKLPHLDDYLRYLASHPEEYRRLVASFLIKVTEFFRDPELFSVLRERVLPELIAQARTNGNQLRFWSAGCATGEEAYSLAILVAEALGEELSQFTVRLFATDLDEEAVAFARQGLYPAAALAGMPQELRTRYFKQLDGTFEVKKPIRGLVTFGEHDLGQRPPFPHIDLVLCRNVLIYFTPELQRRALTLFAFAVRPGGYLALGKAESAGALAEYFAPADPHLKLFRREGGAVPPPLPQTRESIPLSLPDPARVRRALADSALTRAHQEEERVVTAGEQVADLVFDLPIGVVAVDRHYHIRMINSAAIRLLDIYRPAIGEDLVHRAERIPAMALRALIDDAFRAGAFAAGASAAGASASVDRVVTMETGLGERREVRIVGYPRVGDAHAERVDSVILLVTDVTSALQDQRRAERTAARDAERDAGEPDQALQRRDADVDRLAAQVERVTAINHQLLAANQELGGANLELHRISDELLLAQEQEQAASEEIRTLNEELQASNEELETVNEEMEATVEELHTANEDLTARTQEAQALAASLEERRQASVTEQARLTAILLSLGDAVLVVDAAGAPLLANAAYAQMFGGATASFAALDADGRPLPPAATPQQRAARGDTFLMEFTLGEEGARRYIEASGRPIRNEGDALGGVVSIRDITERSLHRLENEFLALASHELRTPLTPLSVYLQSLSKLFADEPADARVRIYTERSLQQVERLQRLVQDLLDARRLQNGKFSLKLERISLDQVVARTVEMARMMTTGQTIQLEVPNTPLLVDGDAARLEQVLMNLLTNAITYAPRTPRIDVLLKRVGNEAELRVRDEGAGIPAADLPQIFSRFYQVSRGDERPSRRGLGLGLYIANELVTAHGGRLEVASVVGQGAGHGTTFTIWLPLAPEGKAEPTPKETKGRRTK